MMSFEKIYKTHYVKVKFVINKIVRNSLDAEELASETMIRVHKSLSTYREDKSKLSTWITNIAKNAAIDHIRKKKLNLMSLDNPSIGWMSDEDENSLSTRIKENSSNPEEIMIENEVRHMMETNFQSMNKIDQTIASLIYFDGLSYEEVAEKMDMPLGTIKVKIHKARVKLMEAFPVEMRKLSTIER